MSIQSKNPSKLLGDKWWVINMQNHQKRIMSMKGATEFRQSEPTQQTQLKGKVKREAHSNQETSQINQKKIKKAINQQKSSCSIRKGQMPFIKPTMKGNLHEHHRIIIKENESLGKRLIERAPSVNNRRFVKDYVYHRYYGDQISSSHWKENHHVKRSRSAAQFVYNDVSTLTPRSKDNSKLNTTNYSQATKTNERDNLKQNNDSVNDSIEAVESPEKNNVISKPNNDILNSDSVQNLETERQIGDDEESGPKDMPIEQEPEYQPDNTEDNQDEFAEPQNQPEPNDE